MKRFTNYLALTALLAVGLAQTQADQTNLVQDISIQLLGLKQGRTTTNGNIVSTTTDVVVVDTRQVISALGTATGNTFSPAAKLTLISPVEGGSISVEVRDGANTVDVSAFFAYEQLSGQLHTSLASRTTGRGTATDISIQRFALADGGVVLNFHFDLRGTAVSTSRNLTPVPSYETTIDVSGAGDRNGGLLILNGIIRIRGNTLEVVADPGGGGVS